MGGKWEVGKLISHFLICFEPKMGKWENNQIPEMRIAQISIFHYTFTSHPHFSLTAFPLTSIKPNRPWGKQVCFKTRKFL